MIEKGTPADAGVPFVCTAGDTPVAHIVPVHTQTALRIRKSARDAPRPNQVALLKPLKLNVDVVELLMDERQPHR
jgi:hypothetical protein